MYTPNQTSEMLKIPSSTLRRYANQYADHLSEHATQQHRRRYTEQDIAILARAREMLNEGKSPDQVNSLLSVINAENKSPESTLALIPSISQALAEALDTARSLRVEVDDHEQRMSDAERRLSELADKLTQIEREQSTPWYRKLIRRNHAPK
jgi:DNA-binding transcriptional MerR regulator